MQDTDGKTREPASSRTLREAIRQARVKEANEIDQGADRRSSELARLEVLKAALDRIFEDIPADDERFDLILVPSSPARLWIDMFTFVSTDADGQTYRLVRSGRQGRRVLAETREIGEIGERVLDYVASQIVAREKLLSGWDEIERPPPVKQRAPRRGRTGAVIAAFTIGILTGIFGLFALGYAITQ